jgi:DNA-binding HxlR family transcriptional regulator
MKRKTFEKAECPLARSLQAVGDAWSVLIVRQAFAGDRRFGEFVESLGIAKNILTDRLRKLVGLGVLEKVAVEGSSYQEYALTEKGRGCTWCWRRSGSGGRGAAATPRTCWWTSGTSSRSGRSRSTPTTGGSWRRTRWN